MDEPENIIWKGGPSQLLNLWPFVTSAVTIIIIIIASVILAQPLLAIAIVLPFLYALWAYLKTRFLIYEMTTERLRLYEGVFNQKIDELELYRVKDTRLLRPFFKRIFGLSDLMLETSDRTHPVVKLEAIKNGIEIRQKLRDRVEAQRDKKRVREVDFEDDDAVDFI